MRSKKPPPVDDFLHRRCAKCEAVQRTRAQRVWKCKNCGYQNRIMEARRIKPNERQKYRWVRFPE